MLSKAECYYHNGKYIRASITASDAIEILNDYSVMQAQEMLKHWKKLAYYLIVKYNDMAVKPDKDGKFLRTPTGLGAKVERPGYSAAARKALIQQTGDRFLIPKE